MSTSNEFRDRILSKAAEDEEFRTQLMSDPAAALGAELNVNLPENLAIQVHEDGPNVVNLVLPPKVKLDESALDSAAGGYNPDENPDWAW